MGFAIACLAARSFAAIDTARPPEGLPVTIGMRGCVDIPPSLVERVLTAELHALVTEDRGQPPTPDTTRVDVLCTPSQLVRLRVDDPVTGKVLERSIDLGAENIAARPRLLALSIAELIAASWIELTASPSHSGVHLPEVTASAQTRQSVLAIARTSTESAGVASGKIFRPAVELDLGVTGRFFQVGSLTTFGGTLMVTRVQLEWLGLAGSVAAERGEVRTALGTVSATLGSGAVQASLRREFGRAAIRSGVGARLGIARFRGMPQGASVMAEGETLTALWGGPLLAGQMSIRFWKTLQLSLGIEAGYVIRSIGALVAGKPLVGIDGLWLAGIVGLGVHR